MEELEAVAFGFAGAFLMLIYFGTTGLYVRRHGNPERLKSVIEEGRTHRHWRRVQSNAFETSVQRPVFQLLAGSIGFVASLLTFIVATHQ